ncbi:MAG: DNA polymerase III subunit gamma/tau [Rickettsiales bacterium]|nr:DNA polymerase III subunit gamma/tau [Rickettsiales bacterium]
MEQATNKGHLVLARKYRPKTLGGLIGQDVFVKTISNAIISNKIHHAFLLTGTRGVGKTSSARILALSLNCKKYDAPTTTPCLECETCKMILNGSNPDVIEMNASDDTGVDHMREEVIDKCAFAPMVSRYKVFIIDEVHMLSKSAFNALLKTLEEPPEKVKFIFATTEVRKVPITILSRCQKFYLKNVSEELLCQHLEEICKKEDVKYDNQSLSLLSKYANGSVRDSLSLLDQAISITNGNITIDKINEMLSIPDREMVAKIFKACYLGDIKTAISIMEEFLSNEIETTIVVNELMEVVLDGLKYVSCLKTDKDLYPTFATIFNELSADNNLNVPRLLRMWQILSASLGELKIIGSKQYFTALIFKLCYSSTLPTPIEALKMMNDEGLQSIKKEFPDGKIIK